MTNTEGDNIKPIITTGNSPVLQTGIGPCHLPDLSAQRVSSSSRTRPPSWSDKVSAVGVFMSAAQTPLSRGVQVPPHRDNPSAMKTMKMKLSDLLKNLSQQNHKSFCYSC
ncbi:hypothetical protein ILYODFUR_010593 [Ilyodon furcidens]|uniref:Uncharacterized protein n=1 Tax=Ilyodon furcidens TaxID=33524 RepID=A0ABV0THK4_9TELE